jgi:hypothetical protein
VLNPIELPRYLIARGLLSPESVVSGDLLMRDMSSRNRDYAVEVRSGLSLFVKQALDPDDRYLQIEARRYSQLASLLPSVMPRFVLWDEELAVLVVELVGDGDVHSTQAAASGKDAPAIGAAMGRAMGALHGSTRVAAGIPVDEPAILPGVLSLHRPDVSLFRDASAAAIELVEIIQQDDWLPALLDELRRNYHFVALIHHDAKWDNFVIERADAGLRTRLVDWELAGIGDPAWDVGSVLAGYLSSWLFSIPVSGGVPPSHLLGLAERPVAAMRPSVQAFWAAYLDALGPVPPDDPPASLLQRALLFCAGRLLQTAYEACQVADGVSSACVLHLQVAANIMRMPAVAAHRLLGLPTAPAGVDVLSR